MRCFVIRGFGDKKDSKGQDIDFERTHAELIAPALLACKIAGDTTVEVVGAGQVHQDMFQLILQAELVVCDITVNNANVFYELGVRHALRKKYTVLIKGKPSGDATPFDIAGARYVTYPVDAPQKALPDLVDAINATLARDRETDSPVFLMMPQLPEADATRVTTVPPSLTEEVQLAAARGDRGWLRLLAEDVRGQPFEQSARRLIGQGQWQLEDYEVAARTWELVREGDGQDLQANLALANLYERLYKQAGSAADPVNLERSNQALVRVLARKDLTPDQRSEARALRGRNLKTLWRLDLATLDNLEARRQRAIDPRAKACYEAYRDAYEADLNHFSSGLAALQMGRILQSLAAYPRFRNLFGGDEDDTDSYVRALGKALTALAHVVRASIKRACATEQGPALVWAQISAADLLFLDRADAAEEADRSVVVDAYQGAVPRERGFYWNAARGQLQLFEQLGVGAETAHAVIASFDGTAAAQAPSPSPSPAPVAKRQRHLILFSGHTVDQAAASPPRAPRFPSSAQARARALIEAELRRFKDTGDEITVLASAAPGADILALEACQALGIPTWLCLPLERAAVAREVFRHYDDDWRNRFLALADTHGQPPSRIRAMSESEQLPTWLRGRKEKAPDGRTEPMTPWSRGNRWMLHQAQAWGADRHTLLALWDHNEADTSLGGTAAMVRLARDAEFFIQYIDSQPLTRD